MREKFNSDNFYSGFIDNSSKPKETSNEKQQDAVKTGNGQNDTLSGLNTQNFTASKNTTSSQQIDNTPKAKESVTQISQEMSKEDISNMLEQINEVYELLMTILQSNDKKSVKKAKLQLQYNKMYLDFKADRNSKLDSNSKLDLSSREIQIEFSTLLLEKIESVRSKTNSGTALNKELLYKKRLLTIENGKLQDTPDIMIDKTITDELAKKHYSIATRIGQFFKRDKNKAKEMDAVRICKALQKEIKAGKPINMDTLYMKVELLRNANKLLKEAKSTELAEICENEIRRLNCKYFDKRHDLAMNNLAIGKAYVELERYEEAYDYLNRAYETLQYNPKEGEKTKKLLAKVQTYKANQMYDDVVNAKFSYSFEYSIGKLIEARKLYEKAEKRAEVQNCDNKMVEIGNNFAESSYKNGLSLLNSKNYESAKTSFWRAASIFNRANCRKSLEATLECIADCYKREGKDEYQRANSSLNNNNIDNAIDHFEKARDLLLVNGISQSKGAMIFDKDEKEFEKMFNYGTATRKLFNYFDFFEPPADSKELAQKCTAQVKILYGKKGLSLYNQAMRNYNNKDYQTALNLFKQAKSNYSKGGCSKDVKDCDNMIRESHKGIAYSYFKKGRDCYDNKKYSQAIDHFKNAVQEYEAGEFYNDVKNCKDWINSTYKKLGNIKFNEAVDLFNEKKYEKAIDQFKDAAEVYKAGGFSNDAKDCQDWVNSAYKKLGNTKFNEAVDLFDEEKYEDAIDRYNEAYKIYGYYGDRDNQKSCKYNIDFCYKAIDADDYYDSAIDLYNEASREESSEREYDKYTQALNYFEKAKDLYSACGKQYKVSQCYKDIEDCRQAIAQARSNIAVDLHNRAVDLWYDHNDEAQKLLDESKEWDDSIDFKN